jgi:hypothetical protein
MSANVALGQVAVPTANNTGATLCTSDAVENVTLNPAPGAGSNRYDLIVCHPRGNDLDGGLNNDFVFEVVTGVAQATPAIPAVPAGTLALAQIYVPGGSASVSAGNIVDRRPFNVLAVNTPKPTPIRGYQNQGSVNHAAGVSTLMTITGIPALSVPYRLIVRFTARWGFAAVNVTSDFDMRDGGQGGLPIIQPAVKGAMYVAVNTWVDLTLFGTEALAAGVPPVNVTIVMNPSAAVWIEGVAEWEVFAT